MDDGVLVINGDVPVINVNVNIVTGTEATANDTNSSDTSGANAEMASDITTGVTTNRYGVIIEHDVDEMTTDDPAPPQDHDGELPINADTASSQMPDASSSPTKRRKRTNPGHSLRNKRRSATERHNRSPSKTITENANGMEDGAMAEDETGKRHGAGGGSS